MPQSKRLYKSQEWQHQVTSKGTANLLMALKLVSDRIRIQNYLLKIEASVQKRADTNWLAYVWQIQGHCQTDESVAQNEYCGCRQTVCRQAGRVRYGCCEIQV